MKNFERELRPASPFGFVLALGFVWLVAMIIACTIDVGQPNISIQCVEVTFPNEHVLYCDGGQVPLTHDAGAGHAD